MMVHPHGNGSGMFDVYNVRGEMYTIDLRDGVCSCLDYVNREPSGGCKHIRRVRLEFALPPFEVVPAAIRAEHTAPTDVELARRRRIDTDPEPESEPEQVAAAIEVNPELGEIEQAARHAVMATDGGVSTVEPPASGAEDGCPHEHPDCEGADSDREQPVLCWDCWEAWS